MAAGYVGAVQERTEDATRLVDSIRGKQDTLEPYLGRYHLLAAMILADRVPVTPRCLDDTLLLLVTSLKGSDSHNEEFIGTIASLAALRFSPKAVHEATER